jgi:hypothetical protein
MNKDWRIILRFAMFGLAIAPGVYSYFAFFTLRTTNLDLGLGEASVIFCPPSLLFLRCPDCGFRSGIGVVIWSTFGLINAGLTL